MTPDALPPRPDRPCGTCGAPLIFRKTVAGRYEPITLDTGLNHFLV